VVAEQTDEIQTDQHVEALEKEVSPVTQQGEYYDILEGNFRKLNNRVGQILQVIVFHEATSDPSIHQAWQYYVDKQGKVGSRAPVVFLKDEEQRYLRTEENDFRALFDLPIILSFSL
jgi:hypothetical protein